jgi:curved DNA-binding protein CbpA
LQTLGLKPGQKYSLHEIKKAYRRRVLETHPDAGGTNDELRQVVNAWEWLRRQP